MEKEKKEVLFDIVSTFVSIITAGSLFSGLGRSISGIKIYTGIIDGFFISLAVYISYFLPVFLFSERSIIRKYSIINSLIIGFLAGGIPGIILHEEITFLTSVLNGILFCLSFAFIERYSEEKAINIINTLFYYLLSGLIIGLINGIVFGICFELKFMESINIKVVTSGALYGAFWGALMILGMKLSLIYFKPIIKLIIPPVLLSALHGMVIALGVGIFGIIVETITYTNTNFDMTSTGAKSLSHAISLSFSRDAGFGLLFGFIFTIFHNIISSEKIENPLYIISGGLAGFLAPKIVQNFFLFVLSPMDGLLLGTGIGLGVFISSFKENNEKRKRVRALILSPSFGFLALLISAFLKGTAKDQTFFYLLGFGILGAIYGFLIIFFKFVCDYYLETDSIKSDKIYTKYP